MRRQTSARSPGRRTLRRRAFGSIVDARPALPRHAPVPEGWEVIGAGGGRGDTQAVLGDRNGGAASGVVARAPGRVRRLAAADGVRYGGRPGHQRLADRRAGRGPGVRVHDRADRGGRAGGRGVLDGDRGVHLGHQPERAGARRGGAGKEDAHPVPRGRAGGAGWLLPRVRRGRGDRGPDGRRGIEGPGHGAARAHPGGTRRGSQRAALPRPGGLRVPARVLVRRAGAAAAVPARPAQPGRHAGHHGGGAGHRRDGGRPARPGGRCCTRACASSCWAGWQSR